ncbi:MAG: PorT family protein [Saprospiraceae bacterium]|nr:PorT family protein [Saprospiraceae bacterium]
MLWTNTLSAQDYVPLTINPKIGVNFSDLIIDEGYHLNSASRLGWNAGFDFRYGTKLLFLGGLHLYGHGSAVEKQDTGVSIMSAFTNSQLKIPFGVGYKVFRFDYFNVWIYANGVLNLNVTSVRDEGFPERLDQINRSNLAGRFGVGVDISRVTLELNYERSISAFISDEISAQNRLVSLSLGYKL